MGESDSLPGGFPTWNSADPAYPGADAVPTFDQELMPEDPSAPSAGIRTRYCEIARLHAHGFTNSQICAHLGYTAPRMSIILRDPFVQAEIQRCRALMYDEETLDIVKQTARDGARRMQHIALDPKTDLRIAVDIAKFAIEKTHGKAKQEVSVESNSLAAFTEMLREMRARGEPLDVTPQALPAPDSGTAETTEQPDRWSDWITENI